MNVFLDANILVAVLNKEYPLFSVASRILSLSEHKNYNLYTSPLCLAIAHYFAGKKTSDKIARQKIEVLCRHIEVTGINNHTVERVLSNTAIHDFEDGMEYYSATDSQCDCILTEDTGDFYFSELEVLNCDDFFRKYMSR